MEFGIVEEDIKLTKFSDIKDNKYNPFLEYLKVNTTTTLKRFKRGEVVMNEEYPIPRDEANELTKENETLKQVGLEVAKIQTRQRASFVLVYIPVINYKELSEIAFKIFFYMLENKLNLGNDTVILNIDECCTELNSSRPTISRGFVELVNNKIINKQCDNVWWINPNYFYAGNRLNIKTK